MATSGITHPVKLGNKTYFATALTDASLQSLDMWIRSKYVERAIELIKKAPPEDKEIAYRVATQEASSLGWKSIFGQQLMGTVEGVAQLLYEGIKENHPEVTPEELRAFLLDGDAVNEATNAFKTLNMRKEKAPTKGKALTRAQSRSRKKKRT